MYFCLREYAYVNAGVHASGCQGGQSCCVCWAWSDSREFDVSAGGHRCSSGWCPLPPFSEQGLTD